MRGKCSAPVSEVYTLARPAWLRQAYGRAACAECGTSPKTNRPYSLHAQCGSGKRRQLKQSYDVMHKCLCPQTTRPWLMHRPLLSKDCASYAAQVEPLLA